MIDCVSTLPGLSKFQTIDRQYTIVILFQYSNMFILFHNPTSYAYLYYLSGLCFIMHLTLIAGFGILLVKERSMLCGNQMKIFVTSLSTLECLTIMYQTLLWMLLIVSIINTPVEKANHATSMLQQLHNSSNTNTQVIPLLGSKGKSQCNILILNLDKYN